MWRTPSNSTQLKNRVVAAIGYAIAEFKRNRRLYPIESTKSDPPKQNPKIENFYSTYKSPEEDAILAPEFEKLISDLGVEPDDIVVLILAWKFKGSAMCQFTHSEFVDGCTSLNVTDIASLKRALPTLRSSISSESDFAEFYRWSFTYYQEEERSKKLPTDTCVAMYELLLKGKFPNLEEWLDFLNKKNAPFITQDTWNLTLDFFKEVRTDYSNFDAESAWPLLLEQFVEWVKGGKPSLSKKK
ncbi:putative leucine zipper protein [Monocercomonoides exilis]|uniref:putative leucine zipper protein n=1 Tax=Monocercomonoides exilis TaxID=2049356 RepID=UPI00355A5377|nr:putative leucine zipper protein [Monocercomonoides exilis]|eukprot:MONOS_6086.1-p1 / transcript=MONOS_6086.1 / gene=MONOS_6086 / organism=Monocercomonoides_exilis_PA203 / gene_product=leucine zipper protein / transcript_product=leucine zipper protein / location=Mono_scaffold00187:51086-52473(+) / protein_length=243 / sequence_SO=supercontig / SO=protein_coding / is_pseudo=false